MAAEEGWLSELHNKIVGAMQEGAPGLVLESNVWHRLAQIAMAMVEQQLDVGPIYGVTSDILRLVPISPIVAVIVADNLASREHDDVGIEDYPDRNLSAEMLAAGARIRQFVLIGDFPVSVYKTMYLKLTPYTGATVVRMPSDEALTLFGKEYFDLIYCVGSVTLMHEWFVKVRTNGLFAGEVGHEGESYQITLSGAQKMIFNHVRNENSNSWLIPRPRKWKLREVE